MTFYCDKCDNTGRREIIHYKPIESYCLAPLPDEIPTIATCSYTTEEVICDCPYGKRYAEWENSTRHPEYENPLAKLTDEELLDLLKKTRPDPVDEEFNC